jgi:hypothetical protein
MQIQNQFCHIIPCRHDKADGQKPSALNYI